MSRSTRSPYWTEGYGGKRRAHEKKKANKTVRKEKDLPNGSSYKKTYQSWSICDFKIHDQDNPKVKRK